MAEDLDRPAGRNDARPGMNDEDDDRIRELSVLYARALDHNEPQLLESVFTPTATWSCGEDVRVGIGEISRMPGRLHRAYRRTFHRIFNQVILASADGVQCETYSIADHLEPDADVLYSITIRYLDRVVRTPSGWLIDERNVFILWGADHEVVPDPPPRLPAPVSSCEKNLHDDPDLDVRLTGLIP